MKNNLQTLIKEHATALLDKVIAYRETMHQHPELSFHEYNTMAFVARQLTALGIEHQTGVAGTGVVALISNDNHSSDQACIGLRSELDALPITEQTGLPFSSQNEGIMHACGHDVHTAILLGTAEILNTLKNELAAPVKLIFQPGEEKIQVEHH